MFLDASHVSFKGRGARLGESVIFILYFLAFFYKQRHAGPPIKWIQKEV